MTFDTRHAVTKQATNATTASNNATPANVNGSFALTRPVLQALLTFYPRDGAEQVLQTLGDRKSN